MELAASITKCDHGIYLATPDEVRTQLAHFCFICRPGFCIGACDRSEGFTRVYTPKAIPLENGMRTHDGRVACPRCGEHVHYVRKNVWVCAECGHEWKPKRGYKALLEAQNAA